MPNEGDWGLAALPETIWFGELKTVF